MDLSPGSVMAPVIAEAGEMRCCMWFMFRFQSFPERRGQSVSSARSKDGGAVLSPGGRCRWRAFDPSAGPTALEGAPLRPHGYAAGRLPKPSDLLMDQM